MNEKRQVRVAVVGAGVSGIITAAHLDKSGVDVTVFERLAEPGGIWIFDERRPLEPRFPATLASQGEAHIDTEPAELLHSPPGACYLGLMSNLSTRLMETKVGKFPAETPDFVSHTVIKKHIQDLSRKTGVHDKTIYQAKVNDIQKVGENWRLSYSLLCTDGLPGVFSSTAITQEFDAVVVASGHYNAPRIPDLLGLRDWKAAWPTRVWHSKSYRKPDYFRNKNVLLVGAGTSSIDIARELGPVAATIYQSSRGGRHDFSASLLPKNGIRVGAIACFDGVGNAACNLNDVDPIPATVSLQSGQKLCNIHYVVVCTGYHYTYPFFPQLHEDETPVEEASDTVLVTDGQRVHNLHKHIFYMPDTTLAFVGLPYHISTWNLYDYQAVAVAAVLSGRATLPSEAEMREEYRQYLRLKPGKTHFHSLAGEDDSYIQPLLDFVNKDAVAKRLPIIEGNSAEWYLAKAEHIERLIPLYDQYDGTADPAPFVANLPVCI